MHLEDARSAIIAALDRMNALYQGPLFDEWVLASLKPGRGAILAYQGPRAESYKAEFQRDVEPLRRELAEQKLGVGDFAFAADAAGRGYDACLRLGESSYLFCNHTARSMAEIRQSPRWREAQKAWVVLSQQFAADPLA